MTDNKIIYEVLHHYSDEWNCWRFESLLRTESLNDAISKLHEAVKDVQLFRLYLSKIEEGKSNAWLYSEYGCLNSDDYLLETKEGTVSLDTHELGNNRTESLVRHMAIDLIARTNGPIRLCRGEKYRSTLPLGD